MSLVIRVTSAAVGALAALAPAAVPAHAQSAINGPSAVTLTVGEGDSLATAANQRTAWLVCAPLVFGSHPKSGQACGELTEAGGDFDKLRGHGIRFCPFIYQPITVSAEGIWNGTQVSWQHTYPNKCVRMNTDDYVFDF
ncbi:MULTISPECIES: subtilase-type protease inhibitor [unclassified Nocardia]|uniref:subtilase-type protease inhibitor n=1 Tax=unclassified Nocardia TaxID=2637762 RepID=UPI001CE4B4EA|nr:MULTISPECIES: subtilase-type protease inhibitor [unclassified Nocardia]